MCVCVYLYLFVNIRRNSGKIHKKLITAVSMGVQAYGDPVGGRLFKNNFRVCICVLVCNTLTWFRNYIITYIMFIVTII